jgi:integrase
MGYTMRNDFKRLLDHATCNMTRDELAARYPETSTGTIEKKTFKLRDGGGLFLEVTPTGARGWRFYYQRPVTKKPNTISFGPFPAITLSEARALCDAARADVANGRDASATKQEAQRSTVAAAVGVVTFQGFTNFEKPNAQGEIIEGAFWKFYNNGKRQDGNAKCFGTVRCEKIRLRTLQKALGNRPMAEIETGEIQAVLDELSDNGFLNKAHRTQQLATRIFDLAVARQICKYNVASPCKNALVKHHKKKMPALTDHILDVGLEQTEARVGELMRKLGSFDGRLKTAKALEMMAHTFPRPGNIVTMEWSEIVGDVWVIPAHKMKMRRIHKVPLSAQALAILETMRHLTGNGKRVFPMTKNCLTRALRRMGYDTDVEQSTHGFRSVASTLLNESGEWSSDAIELQLAHEVGSKRERDDSRGATVRATYNRAERMDERAKMLQWWSNYLDRLRDGNVVQMQRAA